MIMFEFCLDYKQLISISQETRIYDVKKRPSLIVAEINPSAMVPVFEIKSNVVGSSWTAMDTIYTILNDDYYIGVFNISTAMVSSQIFQSFNDDRRKHFRHSVMEAIEGNSMLKHFYYFLLDSKVIDPDKFTDVGRRKYLDFAKVVYNFINKY